MTFHLWSSAYQEATASIRSQEQEPTKEPAVTSSWIELKAAGHLQSDKMKNSLKLKEQRATWWKSSRQLCISLLDIETTEEEEPARDPC